MAARGGRSHYGVRLKKEEGATTIRKSQPFSRTAITPPFAASRVVPTYSFVF